MSTNYATIITVKPYDEGVRIDNYILKKCKEMPFFLVQKLSRTGQIRVDGQDYQSKEEQKLSTILMDF